jgi:hypothetical protein
MPMNASLSRIRRWSRVVLVGNGPGSSTSNWMSASVANRS